MLETRYNMVSISLGKMKMHFQQVSLRKLDREGAGLSGTNKDG